MDVFDVLRAVGGLCLFLFGMSVMGQALERRAGNRLEALLGRLTTGRLTGFLTGLGVTALIQSSSATAVMVVGFVNAGLMTLRQAIHVILGANVGTTVTAWILSLGGLSGQTGSWMLDLLKPAAFAPVLALVGIFLYLGSRRTARRDTGTILLGFATLMFGMDTMSQAVSGLSDLPGFRELFLLFRNPLLGMLAGAVLTALIQSSTASVGILQALCVTGQVSYAAAIPIIMGQNIGTCVTALLSSVGATRNAKRAAVVHLSFNLLGSLFWLVVFWLVRALWAPAILDEPASLPGIAGIHTAFNLLCTLLFIPLTGVLEWLAVRLVPDAPEKEEPSLLDDRLLTAPAVALERCREVTVTMAGEATRAVREAMCPPADMDEERWQRIQTLEEATDRREDALSNYLVKLSGRRLGEEMAAEAAGLLRIIGDLERMADHAVSLAASVRTMAEQSLTFSEEALAQRAMLAGAVRELLSLTQAALLNRDLLAGAQVEPLRQVILARREAYRTAHIRRLQAGITKGELSPFWSSQLWDLTRIADHGSNIAACVLDLSHHRLTPHASARAAREESPEFLAAYERFGQKYPG